MPIHAHRCCETMDEAVLADCGEHKGLDLTLLRCRVCGNYIMDVFWGGSNTPNVLGESDEIVRCYEILRDEIAACLDELEESGSRAASP